MEKNAKPILLIVGDDDYTAESEVKETIAAFVPEDFRSSAVEMVSGAAVCTSVTLTSPYVRP